MLDVLLGIGLCRLRIRRVRHRAGAGRSGWTLGAMSACPWWWAESMSAQGRRSPVSGRSPASLPC